MIDHFRLYNPELMTFFASATFFLMILKLVIVKDFFAAKGLQSALKLYSLKKPKQVLIILQGFHLGFGDSATWACVFVPRDEPVMYAVFAKDTVLAL